MENSGYTPNEILTMQRDAVERVLEMQRRANSHIAREQSAQNAAAYCPPAQSNRSQTDHGSRQDLHSGAVHSNPHRPSVLLPSGLQNILNSIGIGEDKTVVLAVIVILLSQNADQSLILALLYLIM